MKNILLLTALVMGVLINIPSLVLADQAGMDKGVTTQTTIQTTTLQTSQPLAKPPFTVQKKEVIRGTVQAIDYAKREITLKGPEGFLVAMKVSPSVKNLEQIAKGEEVIVHYYEAAALSVARADEVIASPAAVDETVIVVTEKESGVPGGLVVEKMQVFATVQDIDTLSRRITLQDASGNLFKVSAGDNIVNFSQLKKGDKVTTHYSKPLAFSVEKIK